ncbi:universal stress protein [Halalkalicoccus salilacus]|uniref:universal stress protein n=1 Tax=Halalkalicoccus salilacus TaxID=3117459 RepID=UPI00300EE462
MVKQRLATSIYASVLFTILGAIAWGTGQPFIFPSLGPSAFILAFDRRGKRTRTYRIVGSHCIGAVVGLLAYALLGSGVAITITQGAFSGSGFQLALSGMVSIALTSWGMIATDTNHPPACATTLIVSLGLLSTPIQVVTIIGAIIILAESHRLFLRGFDYFDETDMLPDVAVTAASVLQPDTASEFRVMVPISNPRTERQLISVASMIANANDGIVDVVHIVQIPDQTPVYRSSDRTRNIDIESDRLLRAACEDAETFGASVETTTIVSQWSFEEVFEAVRQRNVSTVVMGWGTERWSWQSGRTEGSINELTRELPCDFLVLKGQELDVSRVLVPVAGGPNADLSAEVVNYLQDHVDVEISVLHVVDGEQQRSVGEEFLREWVADHDLSDVELLIDTSGDVKDAITREAEDRTLVIIGAAERGLLSRLMQNSLASDVVDAVDCSVLLVERPTSRSIRDRVLGSRDQ